MVVADVSFIDIFWSMLWFFFLFIWIVILFHILSDLFRDHSLSGVAKTLWVLFLVFLPFVAVLVYMFTRGQGMAERAAAQQQRPSRTSRAMFATSLPMVPRRRPSRSPRAKELLDAGTINQSEFDRLKSKALA